MTVWERVSVVKPHCDLTRSKSAWFFAHFKNSFFSPFQQNRIAKTSIFEIVIVRAGANFTNVTERAFECASVRVFVDTDIECVCDLQAIELITIVCLWFLCKNMSHKQNTSTFSVNILSIPICAIITSMAPALCNACLFTAASKHYCGMCVHARARAHCLVTYLDEWLRFTLEF